MIIKKEAIDKMVSVNNLYEEMNLFLADQLVLAMKIHNIHWFLKGDHFFTIHREMDTLYEDAQERIDGVAERLLAIGAKPIGGLQEAIDLSSFNELDTTWKDANSGFEVLVVDFEQLNQVALKIISTAENVNDPGTADFFTAISEDLEKNLWMFKAFLRK